MAGGKINSVEMYGITRYKSKSGKPLGWHIKIGRRGTVFCKSFPDQTWDGAEKALAAAKRYRDALIQRVPPLTIREYAQAVRASNTSGVAGVQSTKKRSGMVWTARIQLPGRKIITKTFSESIYGSRARELAIQARQKLLNLLDETRTFTRSPGAIADANPTELPTVLPRPPRALTVRVQRLGINAKITNKNIYVRVSDTISPLVWKTFSTNLYGQAGAFRLAMQAALKVITQFGGEEAAQIFMRDYVEKYKRLPKNGISARIRFMSIEDSTNHDVAKA